MNRFAEPVTAFGYQHDTGARGFPHPINRLLQRIRIIPDSISVGTECFPGKIDGARILGPLRKIRLRPNRAIPEARREHNENAGDSRDVGGF
jgi:hypothetical protein